MINLCPAAPDEPLYHQAINFCHGYQIEKRHSTRENEYSVVRKIFFETINIDFHKYLQYTNVGRDRGDDLYTAIPGSLQA